MTEQELKEMIEAAVKSSMAAQEEERQAKADEQTQTPPFPVGDEPETEGVPDHDKFAIGAVCRALCACKGDVQKAAKLAEKTYKHDKRWKAEWICLQQRSWWQTRGKRVEQENPGMMTRPIDAKCIDQCGNDVQDGYDCVLGISGTTPPPGPATYAP